MSDDDGEGDGGDDFDDGDNDCDGGDDANFSLKEKIPLHHLDPHHFHVFFFCSRGDLELGESQIQSISASSK